MLASLFKFKELDDLSDKWTAIDQYNDSVRNKLPSGASHFLFSGWHYNYNDPRCPHDSWISSMDILRSNDNQKIKSVTIKLLGAFHDRLISFEYSSVSNFSIEGQLISDALRSKDWLYDEVHLLESGTIEHVIEFGSAILRIECADFHTYDSPL